MTWLTSAVRPIAAATEVRPSSKGTPAAMNAPGEDQNQQGDRKRGELGLLKSSSRPVRSARWPRHHRTGRSRSRAPGLGLLTASGSPLSRSESWSSLPASSKRPARFSVGRYLAPVARKGLSTCDTHGVALSSQERSAAASRIAALVFGTTGRRRDQHTLRSRSRGSCSRSPLRRAPTRQLRLRRRSGSSFQTGILR